MSIPYWGMADPWNSIVGLDEFGAGTLDGTAADGPSFDACGPAALENAFATYEKRAPSYDNIGSIRVEMMQHGDWTDPADYTNPRTGGCTIQQIANEAPRRGYAVVAYHPYQDSVLSEADVRVALSNHNQAIIWIFTDAESLIGNEQGVHGHFAVTACYGGDNADGSTGKQYLLNSDIAGQHGTANGQWTDLATFLRAQPHGYAIVAPPPPDPPEPPEPPAPPPAPTPAPAPTTVTVDLNELQQMVSKAIADYVKEHGGS